MARSIEVRLPLRCWSPSLHAFEPRRPKLLGHTLLRLTLLVLAGVAPALIGPEPLDAQRYQRRYSTVRPGDGLPDLPLGFTFCRLQYTSVRRDGSGSGWDTDFPEAEMNLLTRLPELTSTRVSEWSHGEPGYAVVRATDEELYQCPFLMATDVGELGFSSAEVLALRDYLNKGGFLWADDFWGNTGWHQFASEIRKVLPERTIEDLPEDHPLFSSLYAIRGGVPQIPSINRWRANGGQTSELGFASRNPSMRAIFDDHGRILVLITHNTDISDGWEREAYDSRYFYEFSSQAYAVAVNVLVWVLSH